MKKHLFFICRMALFVCILTACNHSGPMAPAEAPEHIKTSEELRQELKQTEQNNPLTYVHGSGETLKPNQVETRKAGLFRDAEYEMQRYFLDGSVKNTASVATFKDEVIKVSYVSETNTVISDELLTVYRVLTPNGVADYEFKVNPPVDMKSFNVQLVGATAVY
jgi:hypothetical protein